MTWRRDGQDDVEGRLLIDTEARVDVGSVDEFENGLIRVITVNAREIGVLRWRESWYAFRNICPHLGAAICTGAVHASIDHVGGWDGQIVVDEDRPVIMCPWHRWEFDVRDGQGLLGDERLKTYPATETGGRVLIDLAGRRDRRSPGDGGPDEERAP
jgi:nitrite reductase/ring-hydroxylating ferredoxin subunit